MQTLSFSTLESLTTHAVEAFKTYSGPWPYGYDTEPARKMLFARRCAFGLTGVPWYSLDDDEDYVNHIVPASEMLADQVNEERDAKHDFRVIQYYIYAALTK